MALEELQMGRYHSVRLLGSGGMGDVYLMQDTRVSRQVAIKVIRSEAVPYPDSDAAKDAARLFQREARAVAALEHPNILPLYDFGEEIYDGASITYMVMPYCVDGSLASWLRQIGSTASLSLQDVAYLVEQAAEALQHAHDHQVIHLDVKPPNFLLRSNKKNPHRPTLLLADFGIARNFTTVASSSRTIRGTPTSMAPEQWSSTPVPATDQYALAVMVYELLTARPPFVGSMEQLMYQHFSMQAPAPSTFNPNLPTAIDAVLLRALAKKPEDRFPSISAFADAFKQVAQALPAEAVVGSQTNVNDMHTVLAITQREADAGMSRMITLPGGQQINVTIPAGTRNGQVIRLQDLAESANTVAPAVILTVAIKQTDETQLAANTPRVSQVHPTPSPITPIMPLTPQVPGNTSGHDLPTVAASDSQRVVSERQVVVPKRSPALRFGIIGIVSVLVLVLLLGGVLYYVNSSQHSGQQANTNAANQAGTAIAVKGVTSTPTPGVTPTPTPTKGLYIAGTYNGSFLNQTTNQTTHISVFIVQTQGSGALTGSVTFNDPSQDVHPLNGTVDEQGNFSFSVQQPAGQTPLVFYGSFQPDSTLKGNYCSSSTNTCLSNTGYFTVGPRY